MLAVVGQQPVGPGDTYQDSNIGRCYSAEGLEHPCCKAGRSCFCYHDLMLTGILYCGHCRTEFVARDSDTQPPYAALVTLSEPVMHLHPITREELIPLEQRRLDLVKLWYEVPSGHPDIYVLLGMKPEEYARWLLGDEYEEQGEKTSAQVWIEIMAEVERLREQDRQNLWHRRVLRRLRRGLAQ